MHCTLQLGRKHKGHQIYTDSTVGIKLTGKGEKKEMNGHHTAQPTQDVLRNDLLGKTDMHQIQFLGVETIHQTICEASYSWIEIWAGNSPHEKRTDRSLLNKTAIQHALRMLAFAIL